MKTVEAMVKEVGALFGQFTSDRPCVWMECEESGKCPTCKAANALDEALSAMKALRDEEMFGRPPPKVPAKDCLRHDFDRHGLCLECGHSRHEDLVHAADAMRGDG